MKRTALALLTLCALSGRAHAQAPLVPTPKIATTRGRKDTLPLVEVNFPDGVSRCQESATGLQQDSDR